MLTIGQLQYNAIEYNSNFVVYSSPWGLFRDNDKILKIIMTGKKIHIKDKNTGKCYVKSFEI